MNPEDLRALADRAETVKGRPEGRLEQVHGRIAQARRRRQRTAVAATSAAVVLTLGVVTGVVGLLDTDRTPPAGPPQPTQTPSVEKPPSVRRLTWASGKTIHWGDRTIDVGATVWELQATDDGVVFGGACELREGLGNECTTLWFTDGSDPIRIGMATGNAVRGVDIDFSASGSTAVWSADPRDPVKDREKGQFVAYDTGTRREVGRFGSDRSRIVAVLDDVVYWVPDESWCAEHGRCPYQSTRLMRFDVSTGSQGSATWASYRADRRGRARTFLTMDNSGEGGQGPVLVDELEFIREGGRLLVDDLNGSAVTATVARTGEPVRLGVPDGFAGAEGFWLFMWLDDDRVAVSADTGILVCRLSSGRCRVAATGRGDVVTGFRPRG